MDPRRSGEMVRCSISGCALIIAFCVHLTGGAVFAQAAKKSYYTEEQIYRLRPDPAKQEILFGNVGVTGLLINFHKGVVATVDRTLPNTPAAGKFRSGQIVTGVTGVKLAGRNPIVILGKALTKAEATDRVLVFDVREDANAPERQVEVTIPVLGDYGV